MVAEMTMCETRVNMPTLKERVDKHDREIAAIKKLLHTGMKILVRIEDRVDKLAAAQQETDRQLRALEATVDRFIRSMHGGNGNGHKTTGIK
jgi:hypothetical protein